METTVSPLTTFDGRMAAVTDLLKSIKSKCRSVDQTFAAREAG
jgi:hypothetical protein